MNAMTSRHDLPRLMSLLIRIFMVNQILLGHLVSGGPLFTRVIVCSSIINKFIIN